MIKGIGVDVVEVPRIADLIGKHGESFLSKVFTEGEISFCQPRPRAAEHFAARFAAKEAVLKALGTGLRGGMKLKEIDVRRGELGEPSCELSGKVAERAEQIGMTRIHLSLSHTSQYAIAQVVAEGD